MLCCHLHNLQLLKNIAYQKNPENKLVIAQYMACGTSKSVMLFAVALTLMVIFVEPQALFGNNKRLGVDPKK